MLDTIEAPQVLSGKEKRALAKRERRERKRSLKVNPACEPMEGCELDGLYAAGVFKCKSKEGFTANCLHHSIVIDPISVSRGSTDLLSHTRLVLDCGRCYAIVGPNGSGKSSLLLALTSGRHGISGFPSQLNPYLVQQQVTVDETVVFQSLFDARDTYYNRENLEGKKRELTHLLETSTEQAEVQQYVDELLAVELDLESIKRDTAAEQVALGILEGLDFTQEMLQMPSDALSGGWQQRLGIAKALFINPPVLFLDEPTNHLDLEAVLWLEGYLSHCESTVVVVSHDHDFLEAVSTDVIKIDPRRKTLSQVTGGFASFIAQEEQRERRNSVLVTGALKKEETLHRHANIERTCEAKSLKSTRGKVTTNQDRLTRCRFKHFSNAQGKIKTGVYHRRKATAEQVFRDASGNRYSMLEVKDKLLQDSNRAKSLAFRFDEPGFDEFTRSDQAVVEMDGCTIQWPGCAPLLTDVSVQLSNSSRVAILGKNGCGKSSLLGALTNANPRLRNGNYCKAQRLRIGYLAQNCLDFLSSYLEKTCIECMMEKQAAGGGGSISTLEARNILGRVGLGGDLAKQAVGTLSGGERVRLVLATVIIENPHVLVLDEPTNHLDCESLGALSRALESFSGGVVCISHNREFIKTFAKELWVIGGGKVDVWYGEDSIDIGFHLNTYADLVNQNRPPGVAQLHAVPEV